jgi:hypothetical protein
MAFKFEDPKGKQKTQALSWTQGKVAEEKERGTGECY